MKKTQTIFGVGCIVLLLLTIYTPSLSARPLQPTLQDQQQSELDRVLSSLMDRIEREATSEEDVFRILEEYKDASFPPNTTFLRDILEKLASLFSAYLTMTPSRILSKSQISQQPLSDRLSEPFVFSYGAYKRYNPFKENEIRLVKRGLSFWHYGPRAKVLTGRTLVVKFRPFEVVRTTGPQLGIMKGFRGMYLDIESQITDMTYTFFIGRAQRVRAFDFTPDFSIQR